MKSLAVANWGRSHHRFVGLARESLVAAFAMVAYNDTVLRAWAAKAALGQSARTGSAVPTTVTATRPGSTAVDDRRAAVGSRRARRGPAQPKGMAFLAGADPSAGG